MLGYSLIKTEELKRLRSVDNGFSVKIKEKNEMIFSLEEKVTALTPKRDGNGKFSKK